MKMIYGGPTLSSAAVPENFLFNCTRNPNCQSEFFVPIRSINDLLLYFEFPFGKPLTYIIHLINCDGTPNELSFCNYVIARRPDGVWYGIFTHVINEGLSLPREFRIEAQFFSDDDVSYKYFSEQIKIDACDGLMKVSSCYPVPSDLTRAYDANGIYYGTHTGDIAAAGNERLRYFHSMYVRRGSIIEQKNSFELTLFNNRNPYRNVFLRQYLMQSEIIPTFYKDVLIGVVARGKVTVEASNVTRKTFTLLPSQEIAILDESSKLWPADILLQELHRDFFGCSDDNCEVIPSPCTGNYSTVVITDAGYTLSDGVLGGGESITWTLRDAMGDLIETRTVTNPVGNFTTPIDLDDNCYTFEWFKNCLCSLDVIPSDTKTVKVGNCNSCCDAVVVSANAVVISNNEVTSFGYNTFDNNIEILLRLLNGLSENTDFTITVSFNLYGVPDSQENTLSMLTGQVFGHRIYRIPTDAEITNICISAISDITIDPSTFSC